jgi:Zn finger protein HypA/HybF involved in hydrogenase expression
MVCNECFTLAVYRIPCRSANIGETLRDPECKSCNSSDSLAIWDGITCPKCIKPMRSVGNSINE